MSDISTERHDGVLHIRFTRSSKKNALTSAMYLALAELLRDADENDAIRAILISGSDGVFSAGNDLQDFLDRPPGKGESPQKALIKALNSLEKPLVAAVEGPAVGSGSTMLTFCDFVYAGESAKFQMPFINLAVVPEFGTSYSLPARIGYLRAADLILLGHPFDAAYALEIGFVTKVVADKDVVAVALSTATTLAGKPAGALKACKRLMRQHDRPLIDQAVESELVEFSGRVVSNDAKEAIAAFFEKRAPHFSDVQ